MIQNQWSGGGGNGKKNSQFSSLPKPTAKKEKPLECVIGNDELEVRYRNDTGGEKRSKI